MASASDQFESISKFTTLHRKAVWKKILAPLRHHERRLLPLKALREILPGGEEHYRGVQVVPISKIIGSENRFADFDREFLPLNRKLKHRWARVNLLVETDQPLPAVLLIKVGDFYFVRDGHHRISAARAGGREFVDAEVIEWPLTWQPERYSSPEDFFHQVEEHLFREKTGLPLQTSILGGYIELLHLIHCFQCSSCPNSESARKECPGGIPWEEAVKGWFENCYQKAAQAIEESGLKKRFKKYTTTDLYLFVLSNVGALRKAACFVPSPKAKIKRKPQRFI
ncbi:MAG: hypothetical protein PWP42_715 [Candidatus Atribacteria bacterium]|jgi:hypothetical protein|nr:hypothetical protein [Candidatus Atribacteria bacterium]